MTPISRRMAFAPTSNHLLVIGLQAECELAPSLEHINSLGWRGPLQASPARTKSTAAQCHASFFNVQAMRDELDVSQ